MEAALEGVSGVMDMTAPLAGTERNTALVAAYTPHDFFGVRYALVAEGGLRAAALGERASLSGARWLQLHDALQASASFAELLRACAPVASELKPQLRTLLQYHCGSPLLRTRQFMMDMQSL